jgi:signal-transduction protein with cAMP-binding, CBS, and nucleotidyltransferase domain
LTIRAPSEVSVRLGRRQAAGAAGAGVPARPAADDVNWRAEYRRLSEETANGIDPEQLADRVALLRRIPLFRGCWPSDLTMLAATAYPIAFDAGDVLCAQGANADEAYVITEGEANVTIDGTVVATAGADDVIGERGPIMDLPRAATVTARTHMITFAISRNRLHHVMQSNPDAAGEMKKVLAARYAR